MFGFLLARLAEELMSEQLSSSRYSRKWTRRRLSQSGQNALKKRIRERLGTHTKVKLPKPRVRYRLTKQRQFSRDGHYYRYVYK